MISKYCYKCGNTMPSNNRCSNCNTPAIDMPISEHDKKIIQEIKQYNQDNPPNKAQGCIAVIIIGLIMFGIPALFTFTGITYDSMIAKVLMIGVLLLINFGIYKYRGTLSFNTKKFYNLTYKDKTHFENMENKCRTCSQLLVKDMIYCPRCGKQVGEDIPIDTRLMKDSQPSKEQAKKRYTIYCFKCDANVENSRFCSECGSRVEG